MVAVRHSDEVEDEAEEGEERDQTENRYHRFIRSSSSLF